ncbi:hypothetical protein B5M09_001248 [Aphanomyces astaci]|nr:hypothetical protein B5M09_001248 [Aphanomyces astaci]
MLTSGSTGLPKIVFCTWTSMFLQGQATHELLFPQGPSRVVCASSIAHAYAINALFAIYTSPYGHLCELHLDIHVEAIRLPFSCTSTPCPTILYGTPGTFTKLTTLDTTSSACSLSHVMAFSAGTALPLDLRHALRDKFGLTVLQNYGSTETGGIATELLTTASTNPFGGSLQAVGQLWQGSQVHIAVPTNPCRLLDGEERGEILVLTPWQCIGYVEHGTLSPISRTGFYHTGDGGDMTNDGILYVGYRLRDPIHVRSQGMDVFVPPQQVERAILNNPHVTDVLLPLLIKVPSKVGYVKPVALVVAPKSTLDELTAWCTAHLPTMLQDLDIRLVEYLPCSPAGKLMYSLHVD